MKGSHTVCLHPLLLNSLKKAIEHIFLVLYINRICLQSKCSCARLLSIRSDAAASKQKQRRRTKIIYQGLGEAGSGSRSGHCHAVRTNVVYCNETHPTHGTRRPHHSVDVTLRGSSKFLALREVDLSVQLESFLLHPLSASRTLFFACTLRLLCAAV